MSERLKYLVPMAAILCVLHGQAVYASPLGMSSTTWSYGDEITIKGSDLEGEYVRLKHLCFAPATMPDKNTCFGHYDTENRVWDSESDLHIKRWVTSAIVFTVPTDAPPVGVLRLFLTNDVEKCFGTAGCDTYPEQAETIIGQFVTVPQITDVIDSSTNESARSITPGNHYEIKGALFGIDKGSILYAERLSTRTNSCYLQWHTLSAMDIESWNLHDIRFSPSVAIDLTAGLQVNNGGSLSKVFVVSGSSSSAPEPAATETSEKSSSEMAVPKSPFKDVADDYGYLPALAWGKDTGVLQGYPDGTFQPNRTVNRAEFLKIVLSATKVNVGATNASADFRDVDANAWYARYVAYAKNAGIVQGYGDGTFRPNQPVTFVEGLKMTYSALGIPTSDAGGEWYQRYLQHAVKNDVLYSASVDVSGGMTRKDVVWIVWKLSQLQ